MDAETFSEEREKASGKEKASEVLNGQSYLVKSVQGSQGV